ncbi:MAG: accessory Sec system protein Asp1 [Eubacteriales bacterium]|nr:accessory Sec system protein Asp1 [Eubacteriales bacterium]
MNELFCFVPSWDGKEEPWKAFPLPWYDGRQRMEFDDTVNQIRLFKNAGERVQLLLPCYMPELRRFLHREGIQDIEIYSPFDRLQRIQDQRAGVFSFRDMNWPEDLEWMYTPFQMKAFRDEKLYARVEFGRGGHMIYVDRFQDEKIDNRIYVDDRGFLSCRERYRDGKRVQRTYFTPEKIWCLVENLENGKVTINSSIEPVCRYTEYPDMGALMTEMTEDYLQQAEESMVLITAFDQRHKELFQDSRQKTVVSLFSKRNQKTELSGIREMNADLVVTDTEYLEQYLLSEEMLSADRVMNLSPYDARVAIGKSQRIRDQKILCYVGNTSAEVWLELAEELLHYVNLHPHTVLEIGMDPSEMRLSVHDMRELLRFMIEERALERLCFEQENTQQIENEEKTVKEQNIFIRECGSEKDIIALLGDARIIIDTQAEPDLYLQIAGISAGVPMIIRTESQYVEHCRNGWVLKEHEKIDTALDYFLNGLEHWNQALVYSINKISGYTNGAIVSRWKKQLALQDGDSGRENG